MMDNFLEKHVPPGLDPSVEKRWFLLGLLGSFFWSLGFFYRYAIALFDLYRYDESYGYQLIHEASIEDFYSLSEGSLAGFFILALTMIGLVFYHYSYYRQGAQSIYLMKRLPDPMEIHKRALALPVLFLTASAAAAFFLLLCYYAIYMTATPGNCIPPDQWQKLWRNLL